MASIITKAEYTTYTGQAIAASAEPRYDALIEAASDAVIDFCNNDFTDSDDVTTYPNPVKYTVALMVQYDASSINPGYESESQGGWSYKKGDTDKLVFGYPKEIMAKLKPYCKLNLVRGTIDYERYDKRGRWPYNDS